MLHTLYRSLLACFGAVAALLAVIGVHAGSASAAPPGVAQLCAGAVTESKGLSQIKIIVEDPELRYGFSEFIGLHRAICARPDDAAFVKEVFAIRDAIAGELGLTAADLADVAAILKLDPRSDDIGYKLSKPPAGDKSTALEASPFFQAAYVAPVYGYNQWQGLWLLDALGDKVSQHTRAAVVSICLDSNYRDFDYVTCGVDARALNRPAFWAEVGAAALRPDLRLSAKLEFLALQRAVAAKEKRLEAAAKADPAMREIFYNLPQAAHQDWRALWTKEAELFALAARLEFGFVGGKRSATKGCEAALAPHWERAMKALKAPEPSEDAKNFGTVATPLSFVATLAAYYCARDEHEAMALTLGEELRYANWLRGPRMDTAYRLLVALATLKFDDRSYSISIPQDIVKVLDSQKIDVGVQGDEGVVRRVELEGELATITFDKYQRETPVCEKSVNTGAYRYDSARGRIEPEVKCTKWGVEKYQATVEPATVPASQVGKLKAGHLARYATTNGKADLVFVFDGAARKRMLYAFGVWR